MHEVSVEYAHAPVLLGGIMSALPKRMESTLNLHKNRLLGTMPRSRNELDPNPLLSKIDASEKTIVLNSLTDLPVNWQSVTMKEFAGIKVVPESGDGLSSAGTGTSDDDAIQPAYSDHESEVNINYSRLVSGRIYY